MTIYPAKNAKGGYTGSWTVEVMRQGKRTRATAGDFQTAKLIEGALERGEPAPANLQAPRAIVRQAAKERRALYTLGKLQEESSKRLEGAKDAVQSRRNLAVIVGLLGPETPVVHIGFAELERAAEALAKRGLKPKTVNRYLASISGALKWARQRGIIEQVPPKPWRKESKGRVVFVPKSADAPVHRWLLENSMPAMPLIYAVLVSTGLRISELLTLEPHEVESGWLRLNDTKNSDPRDVPIAPRLSGPLRAAIEKDALPAYETIRRAFLAASEALQIGVRITPHVLRHTAATRLNGAGVPTATIQKFLGHRDMRTTLIYAHAETTALQEASKHLDGDDRPW